MHVIAAKAVCFGEALKPQFKKYQNQIIKNAKAMSEELSNSGFRIVSGGTDCHMFCVDLRQKGITGKEAERILGESEITVNKNTIPFDPQKPFVTSGIRIGTPAVTTRGMREKEMKTIAALIKDTIESNGDQKVIKTIRRKVESLCKKFPLYAKRLK